MLPNNEISSTSVEGIFLLPNKQPDEVIDYEFGGISIQDTSQGLNVFVWECFYKDRWITLRSPNEEVKWLQIDGVTHVGLAFDFNMNPNICYVVNGETFLRWYDTSIQGFRTTSFGSSIKSPQISLDDHREEFSGSSDIIFAYVRNGSVYYRQQRDRYNIERYVGEVPDDLTLIQIGMNRKYRFQFKIY